MTLDPKDDPGKALEELAACTSPWLFGVRHHSPACAIALPPLLDKLQPTAVAIELPEDLGHWLDWLGHPESEAPLAVAAVSKAGDDLGFYPFADFSPELVAIRWAREHEVPVHAIDLPSARRGPREHGGETLGIEARLRGADDDSWEHVVEAPATKGIGSPGGSLAPDAERVRRAALLYGWALRVDQARGSRIGDLDLAREAHMRAVLERLGAYGKPKGKAKKPKIAAVIGSFHAAALIPEPALWHAPEATWDERADLVSSLIPYAFELLDARSGYPAGIRDPSWQQRLWQTQRDRGDVAVLVSQCLVEITRLVRAKGLPASVPDARAAAELAISLAALRGLAAPGRRELVEGVQTALTQGELMGRGRIVAGAMEQVLVGRHRGHLAPGTPRSGLAPHVFALMDELRLPGVPARGKAAMTEPEDIRLDPLRSPLDRRRHVALARMRACGIPYGTELESIAAGGVESLTSVWRLMFTPTTEAVIELAGLRGVTLRQAAMGALRAEAQRLAADDKLGATQLVALTESAAEAGAGELVREWLAELTGKRLAEATLAELIALIAVIDRIVAGHVVGLPADADDEVPGEIDRFEVPALDRAMVLSVAVASVLGLAGSESLDDARALAELVRLLERPEHQGLGDGRLRWSIDQLVETGTPVIAGAAEVVRVLIATRTAEQLSTTIGGWVDAGVDADARRVLANRLRGAIAIAGPLFESSPVFLDGMLERVERLADEDFLPRVTALRDGFETLSTASRKRLLRALGDRLGETDARGQGLDVVTAIAPELLAAAAEADRAGRAAMERIARPALLVPEIAPAQAGTRAVPEHGIPVRDRWRMILGHERDRMKPRSLRVARALDELYGQGHGEGSRGDGGGQEQGFPTVRAWKEEIDELFGTRVFEEVAGRAALGGRVGALLEFDPGQVQPSIELLEQVLSLKGGLGEAHLGRMRQLVKRIVDELVRELAVRVRPAMQGAISPRPTRRQTGVLHLPRTVAANLATTRVDGDRVTIVPEKLIFKSRSRRHMDWHVVLVVDVSGSMEPSVIYSAMMAAILSAVPWIDVRFITFSTDVIDLSEHVHDPLALLLEVSVGGGTHIAKGLRYAKSLVTVPQRTILITVSDFEEGFSIDSLLGEIRSLVEAGVTCLGLAALDDRGAPRYSVQIAEQIVAAGMPVAALTPLELARWIGEKIR